MSALATPHARFEPESLVATEPSCETIDAIAFVVEVFPFVPDTRITFLFQASKEIASGSMASKTLPERVSPLFPTNLDAWLTLLAINTANLSLRLLTRLEYA
jgi:hypothetical protein